MGITSRRLIPQTRSSCTQYHLPCSMPPASLGPSLGAAGTARHRYTDLFVDWTGHNPGKGTRTCTFSLTRRTRRRNSPSAATQKAVRARRPLRLTVASRKESVASCVALHGAKFPSSPPVRHTRPTWTFGVVVFQTTTHSARLFSIALDCLHFNKMSEVPHQKSQPSKSPAPVRPAAHHQAFYFQIEADSVDPGILFPMLTDNDDVSFPGWTPLTEAIQSISGIPLTSFSFPKDAHQPFEITWTPGGGTFRLNGQITVGPKHSVIPEPF